MVYTNNLHEALLKNNGPAFWKCWRANFEPGNKCVEVEGSVDPDIVVEKNYIYDVTKYSVFSCITFKKWLVEMNVFQCIDFP